MKPCRGSSSCGLTGRESRGRSAEEPSGRAKGGRGPADGSPDAPDEGVARRERSGRRGGARTMSERTSACGEMYSLRALADDARARSGRRRAPPTHRRDVPNADRSSRDFTLPGTSRPCPLFRAPRPRRGRYVRRGLYADPEKRPRARRPRCPDAAVVAVNRDCYTCDTVLPPLVASGRDGDPRECSRDWQILAGRDGREGARPPPPEEPRRKKRRCSRTWRRRPRSFAKGQAASRGPVAGTNLEASKNHL